MALTGRAREYYAKSLDFTAKCQQEECIISFYPSRVTSCVCVNFPKKKDAIFSKMAVQTSLLQDIWIKPNEAAQMFAFQLRLVWNTRWTSTSKMK